MSGLKRGHFKGKSHLPTTIFQGDILVFGGIVTVTLKNVLVNPEITVSGELLLELPFSGRATTPWFSMQNSTQRHPLQHHRLSLPMRRTQSYLGKKHDECVEIYTSSFLERERERQREFNLRLLSMFLPAFQNQKWTGKCRSQKAPTFALPICPGSHWMSPTFLRQFRVCSHHPNPSPGSFQGAEAQGWPVNQQEVSTTCFLTSFCV